jgi:ubiquinol-cytochrome c reductase cytochrome c1 subunit
MIMRNVIIAVGFALLAVIVAGGGATVARASETPELPDKSWSYEGVFGTYDRAALRRGFQVYRESCSFCHSLSFVAYRNLADIGFSEEEVKQIAAEVEILDGPNDEGQMFRRPGRPADHFASPFLNEIEARAANNGALPPDLSLITKARKGGADYINALLLGYQDEPPEGVELGDGMLYNPYFPGGQIAMPPPLVEEGVEYADGTPATLEQMAEDIITFLAWAANPEMEARKSLGVKVILYLLVLTGLLYAVYRKIQRKTLANIE